MNPNNNQSPLPNGDGQQPPMSMPTSVQPVAVTPAPPLEAQQAAYSASAQPVQQPAPMQTMPVPEAIQPSPAQQTITQTAPQQYHPDSNVQPGVYQAPQVAHEPQGESRGSILSTILIIVLSPLAALFLIMFVFQSYQVDGPSMQTTLHDKDRLIVWKAPVTWSKITKHQYVPNRGDIVIVSENKANDGTANAAADKQLIKRVIALPGERITIQNSVVTIYNDKYPNGYHPDKEMPYGSVIKTTSGNIDLKLASNEIYIMGDNRENSLDSRFLGPINLKAVVGKLIIRVLPAGDAKMF